MNTIHYIMSGNQSRKVTLGYSMETQSVVTEVKLGHTQ